MRTLVTGGAGFIGSHLAAHLHAQGDEVFVLDDLSTGASENLERADGTRTASLEVGSVLDADTVDALVASVDRVFHLAATVGTRNVAERPLQMLVTNTRGTENVLESASRHQRPVLIASSSEVYGDATDALLSEEDPLRIGPTSRVRWGYACSKALDEFLAFAHGRERGLHAVAVRLFNTVGPGQSSAHGMVIPRMMRQALRGEPVTVYGNGDQRRCFTWVGDVVRALPRLLASPDARGLAVNLGTQEEVTIAELARRILEITGSRAGAVNVPITAVLGDGFDDIQRRVPDVSRAQRLIGWSPSLPLDAMLARIAEFERARLDPPSPAG